MIEVGKYRIYFGDFHGQWNASEEEMALLVAGLWYHGYDFSAFQTPARYDFFKRIVTANKIPLKIFPGMECMYEWGHLTTVNVKGKPPDADSTDYENVLAWFKQNSGWVVLAHPYEFMLDKLEYLLDRNLLDAVELINGHLRSNRNLYLISWYRNLLQKGKTVPIVSGLDIHIPTGSSRPSILCDENYPPSSDIGAFGSHRTGVIAKECTAECIKQAIDDRQTFIELAGGELIGPPEITGYLKKNNYTDRAEKDMEARRMFVPAISGIITGNGKINLTYEHPVEKTVVCGREYKPRAFKTAIKAPLIFHRNTQYVNVVSLSGKDISVNAMKVYHPVQAEVFPEIQSGRARTLVSISNAGSEKIKNLKLQVSCGKQRFTKSLFGVMPNVAEHVVHEWKIDEPLRPSKFDFSIGNAEISKSFSKYLVFMECPRIKDPGSEKEWEKIRPVNMSGDFPEQVDTGYTVYWNGNDDLSAEVKTGWNNNALYFKIAVKDDILAPSKTNLLMFGDCLQIGINPVGTEAVGNQSFYDIMMSRGTEDGREKAYMERPVKMALEYTRSQRFLLEGLYCGSIKKGVFQGLLTIPFHLIPPVQPLPGSRFGLYYVLFDNDGKGLKTIFQWPLHSERYVNQAWYVPYYGAWASVQLKG